MLGGELGNGDDGIAQMQYTYVGDQTFLVVDENDDGLISNGDFTLEFDGQIALGMDDFVDTLFITAGSPGDDILSGTRGDDRLAGLAGDDVIRGLGGDDTLTGGDGDDRPSGGPRL